MAPAGAAPVANPASSLPATLTGLRCDTAALAGVPVQAVRFTGGRRASNAPSAVIVSAIATANAATSCAPASRVLLAHAAAQQSAHGSGRSLQAIVAAEPWATVDVLIGAATTASGAAIIAAAVSAAGAGAYPRTISAWAPTWGYTSAQWAASIGSPVAVDKASINITNSVSFSPAPASVNGLSTSQQLGLGLGITIPLALIVALIIAATCRLRAGAKGGGLGPLNDAPAATGV